MRTDENEADLQRQESTAGLRLQGADLDPVWVTRVLGCSPSDAGVGGDVIEGSRFTGPSPAGWWQLLSDLPRSADIGDHIARLLEQLTDDLESWAGVARFAPDILCSMVVSASEGFDLPPDILRDLADRGIALSFDITSTRQTVPDVRPT